MQNKRRRQRNLVVEGENSRNHQTNDITQQLAIFCHINIAILMF